MDFFIFLKGMLIGFSIAAPVGPIGILCIRRTIAYGRVVGFFTGLGAATADALYSIFAVFGLTIVTNFLIGQQFWLQLVGGLFLCYLGVKTMMSKASEQSAKAHGTKIWSAYISVLFLTITNPMTILSFIGIFAGLGFSNSHSNIISSSILVLGVFLGSVFWWLLLSSVVSLVKHRIEHKMLSMINQISGLIIFLFGVVSLVSSFR